HSSSSHIRSAQRFAILVNICRALAPIARARGGALCDPPATDTCAPRSTSSSQTGGTHVGSFALSSLALKAGFFRLSSRAARGICFPFFVPCFFATFFFATFFFAADFFRALGLVLEFRRLA